MPKLPRISGKELASILEVNGFIKVRQRGSHMVLQKRLKTTTITVPVPDHKELKTGTLRSIIRQSGLSRSLFEK
ncbi:MAG: type II toxin-antitoxin system HicA family toxin [Opitutales bacterium]